MINFQETKAITRRAYELGVNYFDTAHNYWNGRSEEVYGAVLPSVRKDVFITTKTVQRTRQGAEWELEISLKRLRTDYVDLWQLHSMSTREEVDQIFSPAGAIEAFEAAKQSGKCRFIGFTGHFDPEPHLEMLKRYPHFDSILVPLNAAGASYLSFEREVLPEAVRQGLGIQGMKVLANAKMLQSFSIKECLRCALSLPVHCITMGCTTLGQWEDDVRIATQFEPLTEAEMAAMRDRSRNLAGPQFENWKRDTQVAQARPTYVGD